MSNKTKIFLIILSVSFLGIIFFLFFSKNKTPDQASDQPSETQKNLFPMPKEGDIKMNLQINEKSLEVNNLFKDRTPNLPENGVSFSENDVFQSHFYPKDQGFLITLLNPDLETARARAEEDLLLQLGIDKEQACQLKVDLGVPGYVNPDAAGINYGLSFCPNGKPLPKQ